MVPWSQGSSRSEQEVAPRPLTNGGEGGGSRSLSLYSILVEDCFAITIHNPKCRAFRRILAAVRDSWQYFSLGFFAELCNPNGVEGAMVRNA